MNMKKIISVLFCVIVGVTATFAQQAEIDVSLLEKDVSPENLQEISINRFEDPGNWETSIPGDRGLVVHRRFTGEPNDKPPLDGEETLGFDITDDHVLGMRVNFFSRGPTHIGIEAVKPILIPGITKTLSVWAVGRNFNHELKVVIEDYWGSKHILSMGKLNFLGWRQMTTIIPNTIDQFNVHFTEGSGIKLLGFIVDTAIEETYGSYYVYLDDLRAVTDLSLEANRDPDDILDSW
jgi:hypothetical protein